MRVLRARRPVIRIRHEGKGGEGHCKCTEAYRLTQELIDWAHAVASLEVLGAPWAHEPGIISWTATAIRVEAFR